jgi:hypothetical protein
VQSRETRQLIEHPPQQLLGRGTSGAGGGVLNGRRWKNPSTALRAVPLPENSRGG